MSDPRVQKFVEGDVETELLDLSGGAAGAVDADEIMRKMGGRAGTYTETRPDGTTVTYEMDVEEWTEEEDEVEVEVGARAGKRRRGGGERRKNWGSQPPLSLSLF